MSWLEKRRRRDGSRQYRLRDLDETGRTITVVKNAGQWLETAEDIQRKYDDSKARSAAGITTPDSPILAGMETWIKSRRRRPKTEAIYRSSVMHFIKSSGAKTFRDLVGDRVEKWGIDLRGGALTYKRSEKKNAKAYTYSDHGIRILMGTMRTFANFCRKKGWISANPFEAIPIRVPPSARRDLTKKQIILFIRACRAERYKNLGGRPPADPLQRAAWNIKRLTEPYWCRIKGATNELRKIMLFALYTGMRIGEILNARWEHIAVVGDGTKAQPYYWFLTIPKEATKTHLARVVPIHRRLRNLLGKRNLTRTGPIFEGWTAGKVQQARRRAMKRAGIGRIRTHDMRHNFVKFFLKSRAGGTELAMGLTGHHTHAAFKIYGNIENAHDLAEAMERMEIK